MLSHSFTKIVTFARPVTVALLSAAALAGCVEREVIVEHPHHHHYYHPVVEREVIVEHPAPPAARVEVVGIAPWHGAHWVRGHYVWHDHHWIWIRGHWA